MDVLTQNHPYKILLTPDIRGGNIIHCYESRAFSAIDVVYPGSGKRIYII